MILLHPTATGQVAVYVPSEGRTRMVDTERVRIRGRKHKVVYSHGDLDREGPRAYETTSPGTLLKPDCVPTSAEALASFR